MVVHKRRKFSRMRGTHTHGWGAKKKHRGAGHRGGRGMAGTGKRADSRKPSIWKNPLYFGKHGFKKKGIKVKVVPINLDYFEKNCERLVKEKLIEFKNGVYVIDAAKLGFTKILGSGEITKKFKITADSFSKGAVEKIRSAGGDAIALGNPGTSEEASGTEEEPAEEAA